MTALNRRGRYVSKFESLLGETLARVEYRDESSVSFSDFVERTSSFVLEDWQYHLAGVLEGLLDRRGARILIHKPPQFGGSVMISQRYPAYCIGRRPSMRVKVACYNVSHSTNFGRVARDLMNDPEVRRIFPSQDSSVSMRASAEEWSTTLRAQHRDAQPSFKALGLETGFVGSGADLLIIDDPYASPQAALSEAVRESTWVFWDESARVRISPEANVVVMFHRYYEDDIAGRLMAREGLKEEGGTWEVLRYAAEYDGLADCYPKNREIGQYLSPRFPPEYYETQKAQSLVWNGQFMGRPSSKQGILFDVTKLDVVAEAPSDCKAVRGWDLAASSGKGDWTAGVKLLRDTKGIFYVSDVKRVRLKPDGIRELICNAAEEDTKYTTIRMAQDPGQAGKDQAESYTRMLAGFVIKVKRVSGSKATRAEPFAAQVNSGNVRIVSGTWNRDFIEELRGFPHSTYDDQVDAVSDAFNQLTENSWVFDHDFHSYMRNRAIATQ